VLYVLNAQKCKENTDKPNYITAAEINAGGISL
jgi:hypothetical protein